eukprot:SAG31_NODE_7205_length_1755_cov_2.266304_2_plen_164_part_00
MFEHQDLGGWSAPDHHEKQKEAPALPLKWDKTYEVSSLPLDEWGYFILSNEQLDAVEIRVTLRRMRNDCDPVIFIKYGGKPGQRDYAECTYDRWKEQDTQHELVLRADNNGAGGARQPLLQEGPYFVGVWNTPVFGRHDAAFKLRCELKTKPPPACWYFCSLL